MQDEIELWHLLNEFSPLRHTRTHAHVILIFGVGRTHFLVGALLCRRLP